MRHNRGKKSPRDGLAEEGMMDGAIVAKSRRRHRERSECSGGAFQLKKEKKGPEHLMRSEEKEGRSIFLVPGKGHFLRLRCLWTEGGGGDLPS